MKIFSPAEVKPKLSLLLGKCWNCIRFSGPSHDRFMAWVVYLCKASIDMTQSTIGAQAIQCDQHISDDDDDDDEKI